MAAIVVFALIVTGIVVMNARAAMENARQSAAVAEIKILDRTVTAYSLEHSGYTGMTSSALAEDYGVQFDSVMKGTLEITGATASSYCIQIRDGAWYAAQRGPSAAIETSQKAICR
jgi:hypothetical protein